MRSLYFVFRVQREVGWSKTGLDDLVEQHRRAGKEKSRSSNSVSDTLIIVYWQNVFCCVPLKKVSLYNVRSQCVIKLRHRVQDGIPWVVITDSVLCTGTPRGQVTSRKTYCKAKKPHYS